jgi:hypothetical protein
MLKIEENRGALIAEETKDVLSAIDHAILNELRLCTSLVEACHDARLPVGSSQKLLQTMTSGLSHIVAGRAEMAQTVRTLTAIKSGSSLREISYNCPGEVPPGFMTLETVEPKPCADAVFG